MSSRTPISGLVSKIEYLRSIQCKKALWLLYFHSQPGDALPLTALHQLENKKYCLPFLYSLFPEGKNLHDIPSRDDRLNATREALKTQSLIFSGLFQHDLFIASIDILQWETTAWTLYLFKPNTRLKHHHIQEIAFQYYLLKASGLPIGKASLILLNSHYVRGESLNKDVLFTFHDVTQKILLKQPIVKSRISSIKNTVQKPEEPLVAIGPHCYFPTVCPFFSYCWKHVPQREIFSLRNLPLHQKMEWLHQGIVRFEDIPDDFPLSREQKVQIQSELNNSIILDKKALRGFLKTIHWPVCFLDFESVQIAIPPFPHLKPYQQLVFQYSLHLQMEPNGPLHHYEFLGTLQRDPRPLILRRLLKEIPSGTCVITYSGDLEKQTLRTFGELYKKHHDRLMAIHDAIVDLKTPFEKLMIYKKEMKGSLSLKDILPAMIPELSFETLHVASGLEATVRFLQSSLTSSRHKKQSIRKALYEYCRHDTYALVKLLEKLSRLSEE